LALLFADNFFEGAPAGFAGHVVNPTTG